MDPKYPNITVQLSGTDGNAFAIMGKISRELRMAHIPAEEIKQYQDESTSGDYNHLLQTAMRWVNVE